MSDPTDFPAPDGWSEGDVDADGTRIHYYRSGGDGRPLVVAHGVTSSGRSRIPLVEDLAEDYDVVTYDARGHGQSAAPGGQWTYDDLAGDLWGVVDALDLDEPVLYGHSMGGTTVAVAAAADPDRPHAVVMEDPGLMLGLDEDDAGDDDPDDEDRDWEDVDPEENPGLAAMLERIRETPGDSREHLMEADPELAGLVESGRKELATLLADAYRNVDPQVETVLASGGPDPEAVFPDVAAPALVLKAEAPDEAAAERHRAAAAHLPDGRLVHVDGAGHCVLREEYDAAYGELRRFLDG